MKRVVFIFLFVLSCSPKNKTHKPVETTEVVDNTSNLNSISFAQVQPVFQKLCSSCHPSRRAPNWLVYSEALIYVKNGLLKQNVVDSKEMPLRGSQEAALMTDQDRKLISDWMESGANEFSTTLTNSETSSINSENQLPSEILDKRTETAPVFAQACISCHDSQGTQFNYNSGTPNIAGQNSGYINHQLMNYKWYQRIDPNHQMNAVSALLSENDIAQISDYFSKLVFQKPNTDSTSIEFEFNFKQGKSIAEISCNYCHMKVESDYTSNSPYIPKLRGQSQVYLTRQLLFYQNGMRDNNLMENVVQSMSHEDIEAIAIYYSNF